MSQGCPHCQSLDTGDETLVEPVTCLQCGRSIVVDQSLTPAASNLVIANSQSFGKFRLIETVGEGAFSVVWKGEDVELGRTVAVKLLHSSLLARKTDAERFYREARAAAQLRHPGIVAVHEVSEIDGIPAIISEFVEGVTLRQVISERRLDFRESASLVAQVADALHYAHSLKVIHRDVKPGNIMVSLPANDSSNDRQGTSEQPSSDLKPASVSISSVSTAPAARLLDFGLALRSEAEATMTTDGQVLGTPSYMSPEQATGDSHRVDRRSDVYSLGVVLYEMLTGEVPFKGPSMVVLRKVIGDEPPRPRELRPAIPRDLETICLKAMSKARESRYRTAGEFADDLRRFLVGEPIAARPIGTLGKVWRFCRRNPSLAASILAISGILLISSIVSTWFAITAMEARREVEHALVDSYISSGIQSADLGRPAESLVWFAAAHDRIKDDPQARHENAARFWSYARSVPRPQHAIEGINNARSMTVHPTGQFAIVRRGDGMLSLLDFDREQKQLFPHGELVCMAADWNPQGNLLAVGSEAGCAIFDFPSGKMRIQIPELTKVTALKFDPSGRFLAIADHVLKIWDCQEQRFSRPPFELRSNGVELHFSQNGKFLAAVCDYDYCRVWSLDSDDNIELVYSPVVVPGHEFALFHSTQKQPQFVGNDRYLIVCPDEYRLVLMDTTTWLPARTITFPFERSQIIEWFCVDPDRSLIAACWFNEVRMFDVESGALVGTPMIHANRATSGSFSADGKTLLTSCGDRICRFWSVPSGLSAALPLFHQDAVCLAKFRPDDCSFVTIQEDGLLRVWSDQPLFRELPKGGTDSMVVMSPDGKYCIGAGVNILRALREPQLHHLESFESINSVGLNIEQAQLLNAAFSPDSRQLALLTTDPPSPGEQLPDRASDEIDGGWIRLFDVDNDQQPGVSLATPTEPIGAAFSSNGQWLVVVCAGGQVLIIDTAQWEVKHQLFSETGFNGSFGLRDFVRFFPDNPRFITWGIGNKARVWDARSGKLEYEIDAQDKWFSDIQFSHCGKLFAAASFNKTATVFDAFTGVPAGPHLVHPDWVPTLRFSPDDEYLLTACRDGKGRLFDWRTGDLACSPLNHAAEVFDVCFADAGKLILPACRDGSARVWSATNGRPISPPLRTAGYCYRVKATPDNNLIVLASQSDKLQVYSLPRLVEPEKASEAKQVSDDSFMSIAEIISGSRLDENGGIENLTSNEWLEHWRNK
ncbi:MAG TPA: WD40 repeat domain-containing serine/threonine protein kinase [Pirellulaceae bacterium]|nr:WD40 repeat domain-containing serine/threonine protein kinase [Pirellulaceae bacterium]